MALGSLVQQYGYLAVLLGTFLEGETVLVLGAYLADRRYLVLAGVIASAFLGTVLGDQLAFWVDRRYGRALLARVQRFEEIALLVIAAPGVLPWFVVWCRGWRQADDKA